MNECMKRCNNVIMIVKGSWIQADFWDIGNQMNVLLKIRIKNANRLIIGHLNINLRNEDIPCKILNEYTPENFVENLFVEMNSRSRKWLLSCSYNPVTNLKADHLHCIGKRLDFYSSKYGNVIVLGGLNTQIFNSFLGQF